MVMELPCLFWVIRHYHHTKSATEEAAPTNKCIATNTQPRSTKKAACDSGQHFTSLITKSDKVIRTIKSATVVAEKVKHVEHTLSALLVAMKNVSDSKLAVHKATAKASDVVDALETVTETVTYILLRQIWGTTFPYP